MTWSTTNDYGIKQKQKYSVNFFVKLPEEILKIITRNNFRKDLFQSNWV